MYYVDLYIQTFCIVYKSSMNVGQIWQKRSVCKSSVQKYFAQIVPKMLESTKVINQENDSIGPI